MKTRSFVRSRSSREYAGNTQENTKIFINPNFAFGGRRRAEPGLYGQRVAPPAHQERQELGRVPRARARALDVIARLFRRADHREQGRRAACADRHAYSPAEPTRPTRSRAAPAIARVARIRRNHANDKFDSFAQAF